MSSSDNSTLKPRARSELRRRYFHRGYLWPWILILVIPFVLRFAMFDDVAFPFQSSPSLKEVARLDELQLHKFSESSSDDMERPIVHGTRIVRPGVGATRTYSDGMDNANDPMKNDPSRRNTENEVSTAHHIPVPKRPGDPDNVDTNSEFSEENEGETEEDVEGVVDEAQLRLIGERIDAIRRWENWEQRSRWKGEQEWIDDKLEAGKGTEEKKSKAEEDEDEEKAIQEESARVDRKAVDTDEVTSVEERMIAAMEADEDRKVIGELDASDRTWKAAQEQKDAEQRTASKKNVVIEARGDAGEADEKVAEKRASDGLEAAEGRLDERVWEDGEEEDEEERRAAEERDAEEELMVAKEREAAREAIAAHEKEADQREIGENREAQEKWTAAEQREATREEKRETEKLAEEEMVGNENRNDLEQNHSVKQTDLKQNKTDSVVEEKKSTSEQNEDERTVNLEEPTEEGKQTKFQNQGNDNEEKQENSNEEKQENSDQTYQEDLSILSGQTQPASLADGECDVFDGDWEYDPEGPLYTNSTCFFIRGDHNCMSNGRPDTDYLNWRWKPRGCDLPRFDGSAFMEAFRGKTIGFIGDSLARNQMQSMLCMLSLAEVPILLHENFTITRWLFKQHQVTLTAAWSPYLLKESQGVMGFEKSQSVLFLDVLDPVWTSLLPECDLIVLSVGQWYFKPSVYVMEGEVIGCHYCPNLNLTQMSFPEQYGRGLRRALEKVVEDWKGIAILSTFASAHGERGPADEGEQCRREKPIDKNKWGSSFRGMQMEMREVVVGEFNSMVNDKSKLNNDVHLDFLDVSTLSLLRPDGHPGPYYLANPYQGKNPNEWVFNDCLHWCLPGPVDTWNQLLVKIAHKYL